MTTTRKSYSVEFKRETAHLFLSRQVHIRELSKRRKVAEGMIRRWARQFPQNGASTGTALVPVTEQPQGELHAFRKPRKGGRYNAEQKAIVLQVLASNRLPVVEIQRRTGIHLTTLYKWQKEVGGAAVEPLHMDRTINTSQAAIHLKKAKAELLRGIQRGDIDDFDNVHLNALLALNAIMGK